MNKKLLGCIKSVSKIYPINETELKDYISSIKLRGFDELRFSPYYNFLNILNLPNPVYIKTYMSSTNTGAYNSQKTYDVANVLPKFQFIYGCEFGMFGIPLVAYQAYGFTSIYRMYRILKYSYMNQLLVYVPYLIKQKVISLNHIV